MGLSDFAGDWDQKPDDEEGGSRLGAEIYNTGAVNALKTVLSALDQGASVEDIRAICEKGIAALEKKGDKE